MNDTPEILVLFAAGGNGAAEALGRHLGAHRSRALEPAGGSGAARVAAALVTAERVIGEQAPDAVVLCGPGPEVGAAALVAAKLGVPVARVTAASGAAGDDPAALADLDGRIAERLCDLVVPGGDDARVADEIRAWLATYTLSP
jgi:hypothetical protein